MSGKDYYIGKSLYYIKLLPSNGEVLITDPKMVILIHQAIISKMEQFGKK